MMTAPDTLPGLPQQARAVAPTGHEVALRTEGLVKRFGDVQALAPLDLEVGVGEVLGFLRPTAGRAEIFGLDVQRDTVAAHRHVGYVAGETSLWPSLTGAETLSV